MYLTSNLDFTGYSSSFVPVGKSKDAKVFRGTFDGNGYVISNLKVSTDEFPFLSVFGFSSGTTIKNLVWTARVRLKVNSRKLAQTTTAQ